MFCVGYRSLLPRLVVEFQTVLTDVVLFFARYGVAANLPILNGRQIPAKRKNVDGSEGRCSHSLNKLLLVESVREVLLVTESPARGFPPTAACPATAEVRCATPPTCPGPLRPTMNTIAFTPRQYRSHIDRKRG